ncbi:hypothetical protein N8684_00775 [bacterium]|jgi:hypothetical protein|nr:hypothetical protein [Bacteroidota bacterium]MDA7625770.1 hypothetical protein [bacterium]MDF1863937.1 hypothetical protein [Saprospiraceae bacterium]
MARKKLQIEEFRSNAITKNEAQEIKGGYKQTFGGSSSTGFINWDEIEIREEGNKIIYGFTPKPQVKIKRNGF